MMRTPRSDIACLFHVDNTLLAPRVLSDYPAVDIRLDWIGELLQYNAAAMAEAGSNVLGGTAPDCRNVLPVSTMKAATSC